MKEMQDGFEAWVTSNKIQKALLIAQTEDGKWVQHTHALNYIELLGLGEAVKLKTQVECMPEGKYEISLSDLRKE